VPAAEYSTSAKLPVEVIWDFVKEMDNWAAFVTGYQSHRKESETDSVWVLKGDVGVLARRLEFRVHIAEWAGPSRVRFELKGLNEPLEGSGSFELAPYEEAGAAPTPAAAEPRRGLLRLFESLARFFLRLFSGGKPERAASAGAGPGAGMAKLSFRLELNPGGPMAPMVNALMKPVMLPAAEHLANSIMARLEERHGAKA
jgi:carbon monoxide dehydrogenase subunit G